ncbi:MAG: dethiobiotin synthase [Epsilonproteobacteria bacterium]|nr:dethiobiotin synthase [Campylobacterota bacterium]NPA57412.1 dethiobiotin synthase [Campylobacterota bacterium]
MRLFITATNTEVGKTYTTLQLIELAAERGLRPGSMKPIETGVVGIPEDSSTLLKKCQEFNENFRKFVIRDINPYSFPLPAAPYVAKGEERIDLERIVERADRLERECDILFIEGAGGLLVPIECNYFMVDLIRELETPALLVSPSRLGSINDTLLSRMALEREGIDYLWYINLHQEGESFWEITAPYYRECLGELPTELDSVFDRYLDRYGA